MQHGAVVTGVMLSRRGEGDGSVTVLIAAPARQLCHQHPACSRSLSSLSSLSGGQPHARVVERVGRGVVSRLLKGLAIAYLYRNPPVFDVASRQANHGAGFVSRRARVAGLLNQVHHSLALSGQSSCVIVPPLGSELFLKHPPMRRHGPSHCPCGAPRTEAGRPVLQPEQRGIGLPVLGGVAQKASRHRVQRVLGQGHFSASCV